MGDRVDVTRSTINGGEFHGLVVQGRTVNVAAPLPTIVRPPQRQLRAGPRDFVNRAAELRLLTAASAPADAPAVLFLAGMGGVGKTATALAWLSDVKERYSGDHLYVDLRGQDAAATLDPYAVLDRFLRDLGLDGRDIPSDPERLPEQFRSRTADRPVIVFLDNARTAAQVRPLIPGHPGSLVVVTSRFSLTGLGVSHGATLVRMQPLDEQHGAALLTAMTGQTTGAAAVARACGGLPIALRVMGALVAEQTHASLHDAERALSDGGTRSRPQLEVMSVPDDISVQAVFDASYASLSVGAQRLYRCLGLHPTTVFDEAAAAACAGQPPDRTRSLLDELVRASLLEREPRDSGDSGPPRFRMHDLLHAHAVDLAAADPLDEREAALDRIVEEYLVRAADAERVVSSRWRYGSVFARPVRTEHPGSDSALAALERDRENFVAAVRLANATQRFDAAWQLCEALWSLFFLRRHFPDWIETYTLGRDAALATGDEIAHARMELRLAFAYFERNSVEEHDAASARVGFEGALASARAAGHARTASSAHESLGLLDLRHGEPADAVAHFAAALDALEDLEHPRGRALLVHHIGRALVLDGRGTEAIGRLTAAREAFAELNDPYNEARVLTSLGEAHLAGGRPGEASVALRSALTYMRDKGIRHEEARILHLLGNGQQANGESGEARASWLAAAGIYEELNDARAEAVRRLLDAGQAS